LDLILKCSLEKEKHKRNVQKHDRKRTTNRVFLFFTNIWF